MTRRRPQQCARREPRSSRRDPLPPAAAGFAPSPASPYVDYIAKPVAEQIEAEYGERQCGRGEDRKPPEPREDICRTFSDHDSPLGRRRSDTESDEGKARSIEDGPSKTSRHLHGQCWQRVWNHESEKNVKLAVTAGASRLDEWLRAQHADLRARQAGEKGQVNDGAGKHDALN